MFCFSSKRRHTSGPLVTGFQTFALPFFLAGGATALQLSAVSWLMTDPLAVTRQDALLLALFGLSYAAALILWTEGTKLVTAAESGFLGTAETPFAMLLAWIFQIGRAHV